MSRTEIDREEEYDALDSSVAVKQAAESGGTVVFPNQKELQLDLDSDEAVQTFKTNLPTLEQFLKVKHYGIKGSRNPGKYHATVEMILPLQSDMERILLQTCLGSDPKRELLSYWRLLKRDPHPTLFIEGGTKPVKKANPHLFSLKPFLELQSGDKGVDYIGIAGEVLETGHYDHLKRYDTTGACGELEEGEKSQMVVVKMEDGDRLLYVYGSDGFGVYV